MDAPTPDTLVTNTRKEIDIFAWVNNLVQHTDDLKIELFFFNKNYTVYRVKLGAETSSQLNTLFVEPILEYVLDGAQTGLIVRNFEDAEKEQGVLQKTLVSNVEKLVKTKNWIEHDLHNVETFIDSEHDLKRMKGVIAYCHHKDLAEPFYVIKNLPTSQLLKGPHAWLVQGDVFSPFNAMAALRIPGDNQLLAIGEDLFVFNQVRLKGLFGYDAKAAAIALKKVEEIESKFKLSFDEGLDMQTLALGKPSIIKKLQKIDLENVNQADVIRHAEEMGIELMVDDSGAIIIVDDKDLAKFVNLMNDDYIESGMTGQRYEIISKRPLKIQEE